MFVFTGAITGFLEINVCVEEDLALLYSPCPRLAPRRPNREFSVELIQLHIGRLIALIEGKAELFFALPVHVRETKQSA